MADPTGVGATSRLVITVWSQPQADPTRWTLTCHPPGGDHPDPQAACLAIEQAHDPFTPVPENMICAQMFHGPQRATIVGAWQGTPVSAAYRRSDSCEEHRWQQLAAVFRDR